MTLGLPVMDDVALFFRKPRAWRRRGTSMSVEQEHVTLADQTLWPAGPESPAVGERRQDNAIRLGMFALITP